MPHLSLSPEASPGRRSCDQLLLPISCRQSPSCRVTASDFHDTVHCSITLWVKRCHGAESLELKRRAPGRRSHGTQPRRPLAFRPEPSPRLRRAAVLNTVPERGDKTRPGPCAFVLPVPLHRDGSWKTLTCLSHVRIPEAYMFTCMCTHMQSPLTPLSGTCPHVCAVQTQAGDSCGPFLRRLHSARICFWEGGESPGNPSNHGVQSSLLEG